MIRDLTRFVLSSALDMVGGLRREGLEHRVAGNVAARDLQDPALPDEVSALLARSAWTPACSSWRSPNGHHVQPRPSGRCHRRLRALGVLVAVDDLGTGNTSLRVLSELPVDSLKIDRGLVRDLSNGGADAAIVQTIIELGHRLDMTVVGEGNRGAAQR